MLMRESLILHGSREYRASKQKAMRLITYRSHSDENMNFHLSKANEAANKKDRNFCERSTSAGPRRK